MIDIQALLGWLMTIWFCLAAAVAYLDFKSKKHDVPSIMMWTLFVVSIVIWFFEGAHPINVIAAIAFVFAALSTKLENIFGSADLIFLASFAFILNTSPFFYRFLVMYMVVNLLQYMMMKHHDIKKTFHLPQLVLSVMAAVILGLM